MLDPNMKHDDECYLSQKDVIVMQFCLGMSDSVKRSLNGKKVSKATWRREISRQNRVLAALCQLMKPLMQYLRIHAIL